MSNKGIESRLNEIKGVCNLMRDVLSFWEIDVNLLKGNLALLELRVKELREHIYKLY